MFNNLVKLAGELDKRGYSKYADFIDELLTKISSEKELSEILKEVNEKNCKSCQGTGWQSDESYNNAERNDPNFNPWKGDCKDCDGSGLSKNFK